MQALACAAKAAILDGSGIAKAWKEELAKEAAEVKRQLGRPPGLAVVTVGDRADSIMYVKRKQEACERVRTLHYCGCQSSFASFD